MDSASSFRENQKGLVERFYLYHDIIAFKKGENNEMLADFAIRCLEAIAQAYLNKDLDEAWIKQIGEKLNQCSVKTDDLFRIKTIFFDTFGLLCTEKQENLDETRHSQEIILSLRNSDRPLSRYGLGAYLTYIPSAIYKFPGAVYGLPWTLSAFFYDYFIDGNHSWKEIKYYLDFKAILNAFEEKGTPLHQIKDDLFKVDAPMGELENGTREVIELILEKLTDMNQSIREKYQKFILKIREVLRSDAFKEEAAKYHRKEPCSPYAEILIKICNYRFMEVHIYTFCEQLVTMITQKGLEELSKANPKKYLSYLENHPLDLPLNVQFEAVHAAPQVYKAPHLHLLWNLVQCLFGNHDPQRGGNIPYVLFDFEMKQNDGGIKNVRVVRTGTPTNQFFGSVEVNPEFEVFVADNKKVLFIRLEDEQKRPLNIGDESIRNTAFKEFSLKYPENFFLTILAHDTDFYHQRNAFDDPDEQTPLYKTANDFKNAFLEEMLSDEKVGYYFPVDWKTDEEFVKRLSRLWDEIHDDVFEKKVVLFKQDRCNFIMAYHMRLLLELAKKTGADILICCCKDSIDRANILNSLLLLFILILFQKDQSIEHLRILKVFIHAATMIVKKREMNERKERLLSFLELISSQLIKNRLRKRKEEIGLAGDDIKIKKISNQTIDERT